MTERHLCITRNTIVTIVFHQATMFTMLPVWHSRLTHERGEVRSLNSDLSKSTRRRARGIHENSKSSGGSGSPPFLGSSLTSPLAAAPRTAGCPGRLRRRGLGGRLSSASRPTGPLRSVKKVRCSEERANSPDSSRARGAMRSSASYALH